MQITETMPIKKGELSLIGIDCAGELTFTIVSSGYDDPGILCGPPENCRPPECDIEIHAIKEAVFADDDCEETILSAEQIDKILDGGEVYELLCDFLINGR